MNNDKELIAFLLECVEKIEEYTDGMDDDAFYRNDLTKDACLTRMLVIGEYSNRLSEDLKEKFSEVNWRMLKAGRNFYAHL